MFKAKHDTYVTFNNSIRNHHLPWLINFVCVLQTLIATYIELRIL